VPELWQFNRGNLQINVLQDSSSYALVAESPNFSGLPLGEVLSRSLAESKIVGRNKVLKAFRQWVREQIESYKSEI
jgi:hypothetical protein